MRNRVVRLCFVFGSFVLGCPEVPTPAGDAAVDVLPDTPVVVRCSSEDDADADGISTSDEGNGDFDRDGLLNQVDADSDGDEIPDSVEAGDMNCDTSPVDTDSDGLSDFVDEDSDRDFIADREEGVEDVDGDGRPNYTDTDSDGDGLLDAVEAGDVLLGTPPRACPVASHYLDSDSDGDGLADNEEPTIASQCSSDTDGDTLPDLLEQAYALDLCSTEPTRCSCSTDNTCAPPTTYQRLDENRLELEVRLSARIRVADVVVLVDNTSSMADELGFLRASAAQVLDALRVAFPDVRVGLAAYGDYPFSSYGAREDALLQVLTSLSADPTTIQTAFASLVVGQNGDGPEASTEALFRLLTEGSVTWSSGAQSVALRNFHADCAAGQTGAMCFRDRALPVLLHLTDYCSHNGPDGDDAECSPYVGIAPSPTLHSTLTSELARLRMKYVGINTDATACPPTTTSPVGRTPCFFMSRTAAASGSVTVDGRPHVYNLANGGGSPMRMLDQLRTGADLVASRARHDVVLSLSSRVGVVAARPTCSDVAGMCWQPTNDQQVLGVSPTAFTGVRAQTELSFTVEAVLGGELSRGTRHQRLPWTATAMSDGFPAGQRNYVWVVPAARVRRTER